jgi:tRNA(Ile)-lysidine synthase
VHAAARWRDTTLVGMPARPELGHLLEHGRAPLALPGGGSLRLDGADAFDEPLRVRTRRGGERIALPGRGHHHALKHVLQDFGVPPWERERLPLLEGAQGEVLAAGDRIVAGSLQAWLEARGARLAWTP